MSKKKKKRVKPRKEISKRATPAISPARKRLFYLVGLLIPVLFFVLLETSLRIFAYGGNAALFVPTPDEQSDFYGLNLNIGRRYFSKISFLPTPRKDLFLKEKPKNGYRIFVLGGSTAAGFPYGNNLMFTRILHRRLLDTFPGRHIEVINTAMSAINSYTLLDFMDEILAHQPDALLIYAGHNEFYGALGVGSVQSAGRSPWMVRTYLKLQKFRTVLLVRNILTGILPTVMGDSGQSERNRPTATVMARIVKEQTIPLGSPLYESGREQFKQNLGQILETARTAGIPVLVSELVSNIRNQKPFVSVKKDTLPPALEVYRKARALEKAGKYQQARAAYTRAKDLDALRFRAPEEFNRIIHNLAAKQHVPVVRMKSYFEAASPHGLIGNNLIHEHLHPNIAGYFLMAEAFYQSMRKEGFIGKNWDERNIKPIAYYRRNWGSTELDSLYGALAILQLKGGWPFKTTPGPNLALQRYHAATRTDSVALKVLLTDKLTLEAGHLELAEYHGRRGELEKAFQEYRALTYIVPYWDLFYQPAVKVLMAMQQYDRALTILFESLRFQETDFANKWIGQIYLIRNKTRRGISFLEKARTGLPRDTQLLFNLSRAYYKTGQIEKGNLIFNQLKRVSGNSPEVLKLKAYKVSVLQNAQ